MGSIDIKNHVKWSSDDEYYYGAIETKLPDGLMATVEAKLPRAWVRETAMAMRQYIMETAPEQVNVGGWHNLHDPARFQKTCQYIANREIGKLIAQKIKTQGIIVTPWFGDWNMAVADRAYDLVFQAQSGDEMSRQQLDRIRAHAAAGDPRAREALKKINAVAKLVINNLPKPSVVAQRLPMKPAQVNVVKNEPRGARWHKDHVSRQNLLEGEVVEEVIEPDVDVVEGDDPRVEQTEQDPGISYGAGKDDDAAVGWVASKFKGVDGQEWLWTGEKTLDESKAEIRKLKGQGGKELEMSQPELIELVQAGELVPVDGAELGATPAQKQRQEMLRKRSAAKQQALRQTRRATPSGKGGRTTPATPSTPSGGKRGAQLQSSGGGSGTTFATKTTRATAAAAATTRLAPGAAVLHPSMRPMGIAQPAAPVPPTIPGQLEGYVYPGQPGYPIPPGAPGYGTPVPKGTAYGLQNAMMQGGGGGASFPDEGGGGGGDGWGGDDGDLEDEMPHDEKGEVTFPDEDDQGVPGAEYAEEKVQSVGGVDAGGGGYNDDEDNGPVSFPDEGQQTG